VHNRAVALNKKLGQCNWQTGLQRKIDVVEMDIVSLLSALIAVLSIVVVGAIGFWGIERFVTDRRLAMLLKLLVVLVCLGSIVHRLPALTY
jgi:hypothetical protein